MHHHLGDGMAILLHDPLVQYGVRFLTDWDIRNQIVGLA
jgi:hypothetical protein